MRLSDFDTWAQHHHGLITLHASGLDSDAWRRAVRAGSLIELHRHVARLPGAPNTPIQRLHAAVLAAGTGAAASHRSAAMLWGVIPFDIGGGIHITMAIRARHPRLSNVVIHRPTDQQRLSPQLRQGIACTDAVRTLCDLGADDPALVQLAVAAALAKGVTDLDTLTVAAAEHARRGRGGIPALRSALASVTAARQATAQAAAETADPKQVQTLKRNSITSPSWAT